MRRRVLAVTVTAAVLVAGCAGQPSAEPEPSRTVVAKAVDPPPTAETAEAAAPESGSREERSRERADHQDLPRPKRDRGARRQRGSRILSAASRASFERLAAGLGGRHGLAVSGVGFGRPVEQVGLDDAVAWSTAKVPVAMAVIDAGGQATHSRDLSAAIIASDNAAAEALWSSLGTPEEAAAAATAALRQAGDQRTRVESRRLRGGLTAFGQTAWALTDQARFVAGMPCTASGQVVLGIMSQVTASQRWGLGTVGTDPAFKGGWGPGSAPGQGGGYLDRQMGIVSVDGKPLAVAIASIPADGSHETGTRALTEIARWLAAHANVSEQPAQAVCG
jgi:hypothetical protein